MRGTLLPSVKTLSIAEYERYQSGSGQPVERFFINWLFVILGSSSRFKLYAMFNYVLYMYFITLRKFSDMLKQTLAVRRAIFFFGVLSCVVGDGGVSVNNFGCNGFPFVASTFKDKCTDNVNPFFCNNWNSLGNKDSSNFFKRKQINDLNLENRTSGNENSEEIPLEVPFIGPENILNKRFIVFRRKNPIAREYKRGPGFRSWGGKRDPLISGQNLDKKSKFVSWGGKRDGEYLPEDLTNSDFELKDSVDKKAKFQNWGGKKSTNDYLEEHGSEIEKKSIWKDRYYLFEPFKKHVPKRPQFQSWGGKRGLYPLAEFFGFLHSQPKFLLNGGEKRKFSSWGGKRYDDYEDLNWLENSKRHVFQNWGGKRTSSELDIPDVFEMKESESREKTKQRDKRKAKDNWEDEGNHSNLDSSRDDEIRLGKNRR